MDMADSSHVPVSPNCSITYHPDDNDNRLNCLDDFSPFKDDMEHSSLTPIFIESDCCVQNDSLPALLDGVVSLHGPDRDDGHDQVQESSSVNRVNVNSFSDNASDIPGNVSVTLNDQQSLPHFLSGYDCFLQCQLLIRLD